MITLGELRYQRGFWMEVQVAKIQEWMEIVDIEV